MATNYTIYVQNQSASKQTFWCFLAQPEELDNSSVYANSSASMTIEPNYSGVNEFIVPVQYNIGAGVSNNAVGLNVEVISNTSTDVSIEDSWLATYYDDPCNQGPTLGEEQAQSAPNTITVETNSFDQVGDEGQGCFANQSFGIKTADSFIGMTWCPTPSTKQVITPKLSFYVATGEYSENTLADFDTFSTGAAEIMVPDSFSANDCTTVTLLSTGKWQVTPGEPSEANIAAEQALARSPQRRAQTALAALDDALVIPDTLLATHWNQQAAAADTDNTLLSGTITVTAAVAVAVGYFVLGGIHFKVTNSAGRGTRFDFSYSGRESASAVMRLFSKGKTIHFVAQEAAGSFGANARAA